MELKAIRLLYPVISGTGGEIGALAATTAACSLIDDCWVYGDPQQGGRLTGYQRSDGVSRSCLGNYLFPALVMRNTDKDIALPDFSGWPARGGVTLKLVDGEGRELALKEFSTLYDGRRKESGLSLTDNTEEGTDVSYLDLETDLGDLRMLAVLYRKELELTGKTVKGMNMTCAENTGSVLESQTAAGRKCRVEISCAPPVQGGGQGPVRGLCRLEEGRSHRRRACRQRPRPDLHSRRIGPMTKAAAPQTAGNRLRGCFGEKGRMFRGGNLMQDV